MQKLTRSPATKKLSELYEIITDEINALDLVIDDMEAYKHQTELAPTAQELCEIIHYAQRNRMEYDDLRNQAFTEAIKELSETISQNSKKQTNTETETKS